MWHGEAVAAGLTQTGLGGRGQIQTLVPWRSLLETGYVGLLGWDEGEQGVFQR